MDKKIRHGIDDCHVPKHETNKTNKTNKRKTGQSGTVKKRQSQKKTKRNKRNKQNRMTNHSSDTFRNIIMFEHMLGQEHKGVEKTPKFMAKYIDKTTHNIQWVGAKNETNMFRNLSALYAANASVVGRRVNIGGDHSMSLATIAYTLNKYPNAKIVYFDAHGDINDFKHSASKHYHGMPLSYLTGIGKDKKQFPYIKNLLPFKNLFYVGSRCWDLFEVDQVKKHHVQFLVPQEVNENYTQSLATIMDFVGDSPIHISFDVDSIDPKYIPSTGTPVKGGLEMVKTIALLDALKTRNVVNMDITELNMSLGNKKGDGQKSGLNTVKLFQDYLKN